MNLRTILKLLLIGFVVYLVAGILFSLLFTWLETRR